MQSSEPTSYLKSREKPFWDSFQPDKKHQASKMSTSTRKDGTASSSEKEEITTTSITGTARQKCSKISKATTLKPWPTTVVSNRHDQAI